ncbi:protein kinase [Candidatus Berkiella cookevillensis]|uniref:Protein kinase n=1 Tax=Candidatus Berkiella cookevillensis TaxID=437022 RepID=A0A0Q9YFS8_9GAMM|nr:protein kinase [Candidatus Berkiella cookevillensis]MCS5708996.1 protein kinase [Candidatus Berkiella cookevillensis]
MLKNVFKKILPGFIFKQQDTPSRPAPSKVIVSSAPLPAAVPVQQHANPHATQFFNQIKARREEAVKLNEPALISEYILKQDLIAIYDYVLRNQNTILNTLISKDNKTPQYRGYRIEKEKSKLARSISILKDLSNQFILILDIKRKLKSGEKSLKTKIFVGGNKIGKVAWRIDTPIYAKWINLVTKRTKEKRIQNTDAEAKLSQELAQRNQCIHTGYSDLLFSYSLESQIYRTGEKYKQAHYAPFVEMDFNSFLKNKSKSLTMADKYSIADQILKAIQIMHQQNIAHQDIKEANMLISFKNGQYQIKINDFGHSTNYRHDQKESLATASYASPEIALAYKSKKSVHHEYFYDRNDSSFGIRVDRNLSKGNASRYANSKLAIKYSKPDLKNDMWAIGVVFYRLFTNSKLMENNIATQKKIEQNPLLKGLLAPIREDRFTIDQALRSLETLRNAEKVESSTPRVRIQKR